MAVFKCKMCGGTLEVNNETVAECEYCGTKQTLPKTNDDVISNLFNRANNLRLKCEFDKAAKVYEKIVEQDDSEAEAHWGIVLCKYGIEYVEDPKTLKRIPTCHRTLFEAVTADADYLAAIDYSDAAQQVIYEAEARAIDKIQKDILAIVKNEKPFDVFICYKENDENGKRTVDSAIANEIYHQLTAEGFKVFYAAITLEDKLGQEYEPYIFAALNSSKVMLVIGTRPEYFNAVWVKNEWSRFMQLMKSDRSKLLIPCYRDMDAYDLPEEFAHLQAQDMGKIGFINDVVRGIKKVATGNVPKPVVQETAVAAEALSGNVTALLKRGYMALEDCEWSKADDFFEQALNQNAELADAYLGKLMAELNVRTKDDLKDCEELFDRSNNYQKAFRFANSELKEFLMNAVECIYNRKEEERLKGIYQNAKDNMWIGTEKFYNTAADLFETLGDYLDSSALALECREKAEIARKDAIYKVACEVLNDSHTRVEKKTDIKAYEEAIAKFQSLDGWKDSEEKIVLCQNKIEEIKQKFEQLDLEKEREKRLRRNKKIAIISTAAICIVIVVSILVNLFIIKPTRYNKAVSLSDQGDGDKEADNYIVAVSAGSDYTVALKSDGTVVAIGNNEYGQCDVEKWRDIVAVSAGYHHTVGLKSDGTVVAIGSNINGECDVEKWSDIVAVSAGGCHTVGLKSDGTVVAVGGDISDQCDIEKWSDIVAVSAGELHTVGLKSDGTVVVTGYNSYGQCYLGEWSDIVAVSAGDDHTVGLKLDGTVVARGYNGYDQCDVEYWRDIVAVSVGEYHTVGLKSDGTVVAVGENGDGQCNVENWSDIVAVSAGSFHTVGLKSDGTVVAIGNNEYSQCNVTQWKDIAVIKGKNSK